MWGKSESGEDDTPRRHEAGIVSWWNFDRAYAREDVLRFRNQQRRTRSSTPVTLPRRSRFAKHGSSDPAHGTTTAYARGCGCDLCRAANREAQREKRHAG